MINKALTTKCTLLCTLLYTQGVILTVWCSYVQFSRQVGIKIRLDRNEVWNCVVTECLAVFSNVSDLNIICFIQSSYGTHNIKLTIIHSSMLLNHPTIRTHVQISHTHPRTHARTHAHTHTHTHTHLNK